MFIVIARDTETCWPQEGKKWRVRVGRSGSGGWGSGGRLDCGGQRLFYGVPLPRRV